MNFHQTVSPAINSTFSILATNHNIRSMIEIKHLKLLRAVSRTGSLKNASEVLFLSQSALSHQLRELETYLRIPVFFRLNKKLVLTPQGRVLLEASEKILERLENTEHIIRQMTEGEKGTIRIMVECFTVYHWLPDLMRQFNVIHPDIEFSISYECSQYPVDRIVNGDLDIAILCSDMEHPLIETKKIFDDRMFAILPIEHTLSKKPFLEASDFEGQHLLTHCDPIEQVSVYMKVLAPKDISLGRITQVPITDAAIQMVKNGIGITTLPKWMFDPYKDDEELIAVPITKNGLRLTWYTAILKDVEHPSYLRSFIKKIHEEVRPSAKRKKPMDMEG